MPLRSLTLAAPLFRNPHLQTIASHYWPRPHPAHFPKERRMIETEPGIQVLVESQRPVGEAAGEIVMVHGLEGSGEAEYVGSLAAAALAAGLAAHRFHMRTCGGTESYANTLYHAGLTSDLAAVLRRFGDEGRPPAFLVGFSLGGNVVLKLAGELGETAASVIRGVCAVSTPLDLAACARRIDERENWVYQYRFVRRMRARLRATGRYRLEDFAGLRSVMAIDDRITAPSFGFGNADNYYRTQSAMNFLDAVRVPTLLIQAKDDPLVPYEIFQRLPQNPCIELLATEHGGHLGFLGKRPHRFWLDEALMEWIEKQNQKAASHAPRASR
ncbi:MAG TPA: alpha/beta fold hydrolase [Bryobacteraceae bacterium]|nr:alpha/beta fold hydrolase [Bryobacteraceae bacterium]